MTRLLKTAVSPALFILLTGSAAFSWEPYDKVIAVVNDSPIVESDLSMKFNRIQRRKNIPQARRSFEQSRLLDKSIDEMLILQEAEAQSIIVSDAKVDNQIKKIMERMNISNMDAFKDRVERAENMSFDEYREEIKKSLVTEQVMSIAIGVTPPTRKEATEWYKTNKDKLGFEINLKHILMRVKNNSLAEEKRVNEEMKKIRRRLEAGESFESLAIALSEDPATAGKGGDLGWVVIAELDPYMANQVFRLNQPGQLSGVIKSSYGYHIVKFLGRRPITYDAVESKIFNLLFQQKITEQFGKWVVQRRRVSEVKIYMSDYKRG